MSWLPSAFHTNGVFIMYHMGFGLTALALSLHAEPIHCGKDSIGAHKLINPNDLRPKQLMKNLRHVTINDMICEIISKGVKGHKDF